MPMSRRDGGAPFLIDCDPGHDDALAILYANVHLNLVGLTTVFGNQSVDKTTRNALGVCTLGGIAVPVAAGAAASLEGPPVDASDVHGKTGLDGAELPEPDRDVIDRDAADFIIETSHQWAGELTVIATGPLTNVATALRRDPTLPSRLAGLSVMGGTTGPGNVTAVAEINIFADPEAAQIVMEAGIPMRLVGLTVTTTIGADAETIARLEASGGPVADVLAGLLGFYRKSQQRLYGRDIAPFHDVCAVLPFVAPDLIEYREGHVAVELDGTHTRGMTVTDFRNIPDIGLSHFQHSLPANARVAVSVDAKTAVPHILDTVLAHYDGRRFAAEKVMDLSLET
jgi:inosine-uridine nucleoside N-ribohydrolase